MVIWDSNDFGSFKDNSGFVNDTQGDHTGELEVGYNYGNSSAGLSSGLVGYWPLHDDSAQDLSGNGNHGTLNGGVTTGVAGKSGLGAMSFDGSDDEVDVGLPTVLDFSASDSFTLSFWSRTNNATGGVVASTRGTNTNFILFRNDISNGSTITTSIKSDSNQISVGGVADPGDEWTFWTLTYDGSGGMELFKDATSKGIDSGSLSGSLTSREWEFGHRGSGGSAYSGLLTDFRIYNRVLSQSEIQTLYEWGSGDYANPPTDGVSYYKLDGDATDSWGTNDGTNNGATFVSDSIRGQSGTFESGNNDYIDMGDVLSVSNITISTWVKADDNSVNQKLVNKDDYNTGERSYDLGLFDNDSDGVNEIDFGVSVGGNKYTLRPSNNIPQNNWVHIVGTYDGETMSVYLNGTLVGTNDSPSGTIDSSTENFTLGVYGDESVNWFDGELDDVRIYDYALTPSEVHDLYQWGTRGRDMRRETVNK